jgi:hypothetical protein
LTDARCRWKLEIQTSSIVGESSDSVLEHVGQLEVSKKEIRCSATFRPSTINFPGVNIVYVTSRTMAPFLDGESNTDSSPLPRFLVVGAGSRGNSYARALQDSGLGIVAAVADPIAFKRKQLGARYIWHSSGPQTGQDFSDWKDFVKYEKQRRGDEAAGLATHPRIDGVFICVLDHQHVEVASALGPLGLHIMCEKPLGTSPVAT